MSFLDQLALGALILLLGFLGLVVAIVVLLVVLSAIGRCVWLCLYAMKQVPKRCGCYRGQQCYWCPEGAPR